MLEIGERILWLRKLNGWSQRELARRAGVANSAISQMEQGRISPSVSSLKKVLDGVPISLADFFSLDLHSSHNPFYSSSELPDQGDGFIQARLVGNDKRRTVSLFWQFYPPGSDTGEDMLRSTKDIAGLVFEGELEVAVAGQVKVLSVGDGYYIYAMQPYRIRNVGFKGCICTMSRAS
ncbi:cupin domain-containing protein [Sessilibacter sp. MAH1]